MRKGRNKVYLLKEKKGEGYGLHWSREGKEKGMVCTGVEKERGRVWKN